MIDSNNNTSKALRGAHSQTVIVVIKGILSLTYFSIMSRLLTPDDFGYFALIAAVTTILNSLSEAGLGSAVIQKKEVNPDFSSTAFTLSLCLGTFFSALLFVFAPQFSKLVCGTDILTMAFRIMSSMIFLQAMNNITWATYMRNLDFFKFGILQSTADFCCYIVGIVLAFKGFGFYAIVGGVVSNQIFLTVIFIILKKYRFRLIIVKHYIKEIVGYGGWLTASVILRNFTNEIDKVIIGRMLPISDLGAINRPSGFISRISTQVNGIFDTVLFPILSSIQDDKSRISRAYVKIVSLVSILSLLLGAIFTLGSKFIIDIFFGSQWLHLRPILVIFSLALILHGYSRVADSFFRSLGIVRQYFFARLVNWIVVICFVWFGCHFGILGAAVAMAAGSFISCIIKYWMQRKAVNVGTKDLLTAIFENLWFPGAAFILCCILMYCVPNGDYIGLCMFVLIILVSIIYYPALYGNIFRETVINRYVLRLKKLM